MDSLIILLLILITSIIAIFFGNSRRTHLDSKISAYASKNDRNSAQEHGMESHTNGSQEGHRKRRMNSPSSKWNSFLNRYDVFIVESKSTGSDDTAEVIQIVAVDTAGNLRFQGFSMPQGSIPREDSKIHGLTHRLLRKAGAERWPLVQARLIPILNEAQVLIAWNAKIERRLLEQTASRHNLEFGFVGHWCDARQDYKCFRPDLKSYNLVNVMKVEGLQFNARSTDPDANCRAILSIVQSVSQRENKSG